MNGGETAAVLHAYGLVEGPVSVDLPAGLGGRPVSVHQAAGLGVLVSELDAATFGEDQWRAHAEDPDWLARVASEHHAVLQAVVESVDVLPLRLPGIHTALSALTRVIEEERDALHAALDAVRGHVELGVKAFVTGDAAVADQGSRPTSGRDYLRRRSDEAAAKEQTRARRQTALVEAHEELARVATRAVSNPPQDAALSGRKEPMVLNGAYLVPRERFDDFVARAERIADGLRADGLHLEATGPWPPYNFSTPPDPGTETSRTAHAS